MNGEDKKNTKICRKCRKRFPLGDFRVCIQHDCCLQQSSEGTINIRCQLCAGRHHVNHQLINLDLFIEYIKLGLQKNKIEELENKSGLATDIEDMIGFIQSQLESSLLTINQSASLQLRVVQFSTKRREIFESIQLNLNKLAGSSYPLFESLITFHFAKDIFLSSSPLSNPSLSQISLSFKQELINQTNYLISLDKYKTWLSISEDNNTFSIKPSLLDLPQLSGSCIKEIVQTKGHAFTFSTPHRGFLKVNQPSMFRVGLGHVGMIFNQHLQYFDVENGIMRDVRSVPLLKNQVLMVEQLNKTELIVVENQKLSVVCSETGATVKTFDLDEQPRLLRKINSHLVTYLIEYTLIIWDLQTNSVIDKIMLKAMMIQDIIEIAPNRLSIIANDWFIYNYDLKRKKFLKTINQSGFASAQNGNCDDAIFVKISNNTLLSSFCGSRNLSVWNTSTGKCVRTLASTVPVFSALLVQPNTLAIGSKIQITFLNIPSGITYRYILMNEQVNFVALYEFPQINTNSFCNIISLQPHSTSSEIRSLFSYDSKTLLALSPRSLYVFQ